MSDNTVKQINTDDLRTMEDQEGLVLQGCGGDPQEWVDGINGLLTEAGILLDGSKFENVSVFQHDGLTNLLFPFEDVKLDVGRLAMWRIQTHNKYGGTWLSDYVPNRLGGFVQKQIPEKPRMELIGHDGNIFSIMGRASFLLQMAGMDAENKEMVDRVTSCEDYNKALSIISEYVETELSPPQAKMELSAAQLEQLDVMENAVYQTILVFLKKTESEFPWNMEYIGNVTDAIEKCLMDMGQRVYRPAIITQNNGRQSVADYQEQTPQIAAHKSQKSTQKKKGRNAHER